ncbi:MAG: hypothetical protein ACLTTO_10415 [Lachnospiraceae bacterium]
MARAKIQTAPYSDDSYTTRIHMRTAAMAMTAMVQNDAYADSGYSCRWCLR